MENKVPGTRILESAWLLATAVSTAAGLGLLLVKWDWQYRVIALFAFTTVAFALAAIRSDIELRRSRTPRATLDFDPEPKSEIPGHPDVSKHFLTFSVLIENKGDATIPGARLAFARAEGRIPDHFVSTHPFDIPPTRGVPLRIPFIRTWTTPAVPLNPQIQFLGPDRWFAPDFPARPLTMLLRLDAGERSAFLAVRLDTGQGTGKPFLTRIDNFVLDAKETNV